jgi:hypothetical protein
MCMLAGRKKNVSVDRIYTSNRKKERSECIYPSTKVLGHEYNRDEIVRGLSNRR